MYGPLLRPARPESIPPGQAAERLFDLVRRQFGTDFRWKESFTITVPDPDETAPVLHHFRVGERAVFFVVELQPDGTGLPHAFTPEHGALTADNAAAQYLQDRARRRASP